MFRRLGRAAVLGAVLTMFVGVGAALAHEARDVGDYSFVVGFLDEPVYTGQKSGLDLRVSHGRAAGRGSRGDAPGDGHLRRARPATLPISAALRRAGLVPSRSSSRPPPDRTRSASSARSTAPPIDESFTSGPGHVQRGAGRDRRPVPGRPCRPRATRPVTREAGAAAAGTATLALVVGGAGLLAGLVALGLSWRAAEPDASTPGVAPGRRLRPARPARRPGTAGRGGRAGACPRAAGGQLTGLGDRRAGGARRRSASSSASRSRRSSARLDIADLNGNALLDPRRRRSTRMTRMPWS